jgi:arginyl-tRNA synthetase
MVEEIKQLVGDRKVEYPTNSAHGDYAVNMRGEAASWAEKITQTKPAWLDRVEVVGDFLNFFLAPAYFQTELGKILEQKNKYGWSNTLAGQKTIVEYTDPNPFKEFHIGHLMSNAIGESFSRLIESQGAEVKRACYQGDVGLHVARAIWGLLKLAPAEFDIGTLARAYALGATQGDEGEIKELNKKIYERSDEQVNQLYDAGKKISLDYFEQIYQKLGTKFDFKFFESDTGVFGKQVVEEHVADGVFEKSDGAVVFKGSHTRVFINSQGLPTYEAKELGLAKLKAGRYPYDRSVVVTGNEVNDYFKVLLEAMTRVFPELAAKTVHKSHGMLRLPTGKMSSRTGDVITAESLLAQVREQGGDRVTDEIAVAAVKYSILRQAPGRDIVFDLAKSISFEGDSGPYLQYTAVRARAVLERATTALSPGGEVSEVEKILIHFPEIVSRAAAELAPQHLVTYLTNLASAFNAYYAKNKIIGSKEEAHRLALTAAIAQVLANGLWLLGIIVPEKM